MTTLLCINPSSRSGSECDIHGFQARLSVLGPVIFHELGAHNPLPPVIDELGGDLERIVIGGGDGTINHSLSDVRATGVPLGILPLGTANDLARSLSIDGDPMVALDAIIDGHIREIDLAEANGHLFVNAAGIGLGPELTETLDEQRKKRLGVLAYLVSMIEVVWRYQDRRARLSIDGKLKHTSFIQITLASGIHYGGGLTITEDAKLDDGLLRVLCLKPQTVLHLMSKFATLRWGRKKNPDDRTLTLHTAREVQIVTRKPRDVTVDGELLTQTPLVCRILPNTLKVYAPNQNFL